MSGAAGAVALIGLVGIGLDFAEAPPRSNPLASPFGFRLGRSPGPVQANAPSRPYGAPSAGGIPSIRPRRPSRSRTPTPRPAPTARRPAQTAVPSPPVPSPTPTWPAATPTPSPSPTPSPGPERKVLDLVNAERAGVGCAALREEPLLATAARKHSADMAERDYFDHVTPEGLTPWDRARAEGYDEPAAENIARGQQTPEEVVQAWMDSAGHRENILNCDYKAMGVGVAYGDGGPWWTQMFGFV